MMAQNDPKSTLELLKQLQENLTAQLRLQREIDESPGKIAALEQDTAEQTQLVERAEEKLQEEKLNDSRLEGELKSLQENLSNKHQQTLEVKTNEQLWAIQKEIKYLEEKISETEMAIIQSLEDLDAREEELKEARERFESHSSDNKARISELHKNLESMNREIAEVTSRLTDIRSRIPNEHAQLLDRISSAKSDGVALAEAKDETCLACNFRIRPQIYVEIKLGKGIYQCDNCSRILYHKGEAAG